MGRRADGRTYEQLRGALARLERTMLESSGAYCSAVSGDNPEISFTLLSSVAVQRRRAAEREQMHLFGNLAAGEPGDARVVLSPTLRANLFSRHVVSLNVGPLSRALLTRGAPSLPPARGRPRRGTPLVARTSGTAGRAVAPHPALSVPPAARAAARA